MCVCVCVFITTFAFFVFMSPVASFCSLFCTKMLGCGKVYMNTQFYISESYRLSMQAGMVEKEGGKSKERVALRKKITDVESKREEEFVTWC